VSGSFGCAASLPNRAWSYGPTLSWSALDLGSVHSRVVAAEARAKQAAARYKQVVLVAIEEAENAVVDIGRSRERLIHVLCQAEASRKATDVARIQFKAGSVDFLVLLDAERTQLAAEDAVARAEIDTNRAAMGSYKAIGGGWGLSDPGQFETLKVLTRLSRRDVSSVVNRS